MKYLYLSLIFCLTLGIFSCSSSKQYYDDGVRIKEDKQNKYKNIPDLNQKRNPSTLRGRVYRVETIYKGCGEADPYASEQSYLIFKDSTINSPLERIPLEDVILIGLEERVNLDTNFFENFNDPLDPRAIREVPHTYSYRDTCDTSEPCDCEQLAFGIDCPTAYKCRDSVTANRWYFLEFRGGYGVYNDREPDALIDKARDEYFGEIAMGFRFGSRNQYGLGLLYSTGVPLYNSLDVPDITGDDEPQSIYRPLVFLHGKYYFGSERALANNASGITKSNYFCMRPFVYGNLGMAIDDLTLDLNCFTVSECEECKEQVREADPDMDISIALSYGLGAGIDIPVSCDFDISLDLGWRSVAFGEKSPFTLFGALIPEKRRVNMFIFRVGITL